MATGNPAQLIPPRHRQAAWLCQEVYEPAASDALSGDLIVRRCQVTCQHCGDTDSVDCVAQLTTVGEYTYIALRGTDSAIDWLANIDCRPCPLSGEGLMVANGWRHGASALLKPLVSRLRQRGSESDKLIITGHSKGAAEAAILAYMLAWLGYDVQELVTFGSPRPGKGAFAAAITRLIPLITRYVNGPDPVTWSPPWHWGFRHVGRSVQLHHTTLGNLWRIGRNITILVTEYHAMHNYTQAIEEIDS